MNLLPIFLSVAHADWTTFQTKDSCVYEKATPEGDVQPLRVTCEWKIPATTVQQALAKGTAHDEMFSSVEESRSLGPAPGGGERLYQIHTAPGIANREVVIDLVAEPIPEGMRYRWAKAADQSALTGQMVEVALDTGSWEVTSTPAGLAKVIYELRYQPGGSVPGFLVRWFQGSGVETLIGELRTWVGVPSP